MLAYPEFLRNYFNIDTSSLKIDPLDTSYKPPKIPVVNIDLKEAFEEYLIEEERIEKTYKDYLKKKQDRFRRKLK